MSEFRFMNNKKLSSPAGFKTLAKLLKIVILLFPLSSFSQIDTTVTLTFDFNDHEIKEKDNKVVPKGVGTQFTADRFGNEGFALHTAGNRYSYINLGTSPLLKSPIISVSLWMKMNTRIYIGKGYDTNPILVTKNGPGDDFIHALTIVYDCYSHRLGGASTKDSTEEAMVTCNEDIIFNKWYHFVFVCNNSSMALYVNGKLASHTKKNFVTKYMATDSMILAHTANKKNERYFMGVIDDVQFFHRTLSADDVDELYHAPNPNEFKQKLHDALKYVYIIAGFIAILIFILIRNKQTLRKQKEQIELSHKFSQMELKAIKSQMNPHFISNCLVAIQDLIYDKNIDNAVLYLARFSFFLRQVLNYSDENYISMARELEMIKLYVELEQLRFTDKFKFEINVDSSIDQEEVMVPSLIAQPFIENAIWHGLLPLKGLRKAKLTVTISNANGVITIVIEDNGVGRNLSKVTERKSKGTQLALDKIKSLNRLAENNSYKIEIIDLLDGEVKSGTKIIIHLGL